MSLLLSNIFQELKQVRRLLEKIASNTAPVSGMNNEFCTHLWESSGDGYFCADCGKKQG